MYLYICHDKCKYKIIEIRVSWVGQSAKTYQVASFSFLFLLEEPVKLPAKMMIRMKMITKTMLLNIEMMMIIMIMMMMMMTMVVTTTMMFRTILTKVERDLAEQSGVSTSYIEWNAEKFTWDKILEHFWGGFPFYDFPKKSGMQNFFRNESWNFCFKEKYLFFF